MIIVVLILLGLCFGSFVNAYEWRLHEQANSKRRKAKRNQELSILHGHSMCPHCGHMLAAKDLIPVISWLRLQGKCRYCHKPISWQYPIVELATAGLFLLSYYSWPYSVSGFQIILFSLWLLILTGLIVLFIYDLKWMMLPDRITYPLAAITTVFALLHVHQNSSGFPGIISAAFAIVIIAGLFYLLFQLSDGRWIGGGDVKLGLSLGLLAGTPFKALLVLFLASLLGTIMAIPKLLTEVNKRQIRLPFGPFLIIASCIVVLYDNQIITWLQSALLIS